MSSFICEHCGTEILDSPTGYTTECEHYPLEAKVNQTKKDLSIKERRSMEQQVLYFLDRVIEV